MNRFNRVAIFVLAAGSLCSASAFASPYSRYDSRYDNRYDSRYSGERGADTDYAQVISARPVYSEVRVSSPRQECWDERVVYREESRGLYRDDDRYRVGAADRTIGAVIGGVIGGAIGHQFSEGSGKQIATAIGAVVGADVGRNAVRGGGSRYYADETRERVAYEPRCRTVHEARYESRVDGYDVTYRYNGQVYQTRLPYDPGARLPVRVEVTPLR